MADEIDYDVVSKFMSETIEKLYLEAENLTPSQIETLPSFQDTLITLMNEKQFYIFGKSHTSDANHLRYDILAILYNPTEDPIECSIQIGEEIYDSYVIPPKSTVFPLRGTMIPTLCLSYHRLSIFSSNPNEIIHIGVNVQGPPERRNNPWPWPVRNPRRHILTPYLVEFESGYGVYDQGMFGMIQIQEEYESYKEKKPGWDWPSYQDWFGIHARSRKRSQKRCELIKDELLYLGN